MRLLSGRGQCRHRGARQRLARSGSAGPPAPGGRLYKPLYALLIVDLDGRLNLNAHGSLAQASSGSLVTPARRLSSLPAAAPAARGQGFGPADINLQAVLGGHNDQQIMTGNAAYDGRYGGTGVPGTGNLGPVMANKWLDYGQNAGAGYWSFLTAPATTSANDAGAYGSPVDPFGYGAVGLDQAGRPIYAPWHAGSIYYGFGAINGLPYELNLGPNQARGLPKGIGATNNPFSLSELERLLRPFDRDTSRLPARLAASAPNLLPFSSTPDPLNRLKVTTESWDVPCPIALLPDVHRRRGRHGLTSQLTRIQSVPHARQPWARRFEQVARPAPGQRPVGTEDEHQPSVRQRAGRCGHRPGRWPHGNRRRPDEERRLRAQRDCPSVYGVVQLRRPGRDEHASHRPRRERKCRLRAVPMRWRLGSLRPATCMCWPV